jgi:DNA-directed RNA polymerase subunit RPC12/RpoP
MAQREPQQYIWVGLFGLSHEIPGADGEAIVLLDVRYRVEIRFQCPSCGQDLQHTTRLLQANRHMSCRACGVRIHIGSQTALKNSTARSDKVPPEITIIHFYWIQAPTTSSGTVLTERHGFGAFRQGRTIEVTRKIVVYRASKASLLVLVMYT